MLHSTSGYLNMEAAGTAWTFVPIYHSSSVSSCLCSWLTDWKYNPSNYGYNF